jgi:hypothetical protein
MILHSSGSSNTISHFTTIRYSREEHDLGLLIESSHSRVEDCESGCGPIRVNKGRNVTLSNVNCGEKIRIDSKAVDVTLINCRGQQLVSPNTGVTTRDCNFKEMDNKNLSCSLT